METGWTDSGDFAGKGLWGLSNAQCANGDGTSDYWAKSDYCSWLRSGSVDYAIDAACLRASGEYCDADYVDHEYAVRPALHLDLKSAALAAGILTPDLPDAGSGSGSGSTPSAGIETSIVLPGIALIAGAVVLAVVLKKKEQM